MKTYKINIREVWISTREVTVESDVSIEAVIQLALDQDDEAQFEYSHTLDSENHTVEEVK